MSTLRTIDEAFEVSPMDRIRPYGPLTPVVEEESESSISISPKDNGISNTSNFSQDDTISQDSASLIGGLYADPSHTWWNHPKIRDNLKVVFASLCLLIVGLGLIIVGIISYLLPELSGYQGIIFLVAGVICFTPGAYHIVYVYCAAKGKRGFDFRHLPLFN